MNLFRSEEHIERWLGVREPGATIGIATLSDLAHAWWDDRLAPDWRPHTPEQNGAIRGRPGLDGESGTLPWDAAVDPAAAAAGWAREFAARRTRTSMSGGQAAGRMPPGRCSRTPSFARAS